MNNTIIVLSGCHSLCYLDFMQHDCSCSIQIFKRVLLISVKGLKARLAEHQHKLYQVLDEGKHLLLSVCCPALENQLALLGEHWLNNTAKVNKELQRLEAILKHWSRSETCLYQRLLHE